MRSYHWGMILLFLFVGYMAGIYWPSPGGKLRATIGM